MTKLADNTVLDAALDKIATATNLTICSGAPIDYAAISGVALGTTTLIAGDGNGDYVVAEGDTNGRKLTVGAKTGVTVDTSGTATHAVLDDGVTLLYTTEVTSQVLTSGNTFSTNAWDIEIADPT